MIKPFSDGEKEKKELYRNRTVVVVFDGFSGEASNACGINHAYMTAIDVTSDSYFSDTTHKPSRGKNVVFVLYKLQVFLIMYLRLS